MPYEDDQYDDRDDEDWNDDGGESDDEEAVPCPECRKPVPGFLDKCPACGYWLSAADRRRLRSNESKPKWVLITAIVLIAIFLLSLPGIWELIFG